MVSWSMHYQRGCPMSFYFWKDKQMLTFDSVVAYVLVLRVIIQFTKSGVISID
jgi:hypothetical protein